MDELEQLLQTLKSIKEATTKEVQELYSKYELMGATGVNPQNGEVFLKNQNYTLLVCDDVITPKSIQEMMEQCGMQYDAKYNDRVLHYIASDESVDASGDIVRQKGWNYKVYDMNPNFMYCHMYDVLPLGKGIKHTVKDNALHIFNMFSVENDWADLCLRMAREKMFNGNSVGFIPKKVLRVEDENERNKLGLGRYGVIFESQTLLEDSACSIGCNHSALVQNSISSAVIKGIVPKQTLINVVKGASGQAYPDSIKMIADCALVNSGEKKSYSLPPVTKTEEKPFIDQLKEIWEQTLANYDKQNGKSIEDLKTSIETKLTSIESDMADIKEKINSAGNGGSDDLNAGNTHVDKDLYDQLLDGIGELNSKI